MTPSTPTTACSTSSTTCWPPHARGLRPRAGPSRAAGPPARPRRAARPPWSGSTPSTTPRWAGCSTASSTGCPPRPASALIERAEGVPLFAVETVRALIDRDAVVPRDGRYVPADGVEVDLDAIGAPASLQALSLPGSTRWSPRSGGSSPMPASSAWRSRREGLAALDPDDATSTQCSDSLQRKEILALRADRFSAERGPVPVRPVGGPPGRLRHPVPPRPQAAPPRGRHYLSAEPEAARPGRRDRPAPARRGRRLRPHPIRTGALKARARDLLVAGAARAQSLGSHSEAERLLETALARTDHGDELAVARLHASPPWPPGTPAPTQALHTPARQRGASTTWACPCEAGSAAASLASALAPTGDNGGALEIALPRWTALEDVGS